MVFGPTSQMFRVFLRESLLQTYLEPAQSEKKGKKNICFSLRTHLTVVDIFSRPVVGRETLSPLAPAVGPQLKLWLCLPPPPLMAVSTIPSMCHSSRYCKQRSWMIRFWSVRLEPARYMPAKAFRGTKRSRTSWPLLLGTNATQGRETEHGRSCVCVWRRAKQESPVARKQKVSTSLL